jgi:DNA-binding transcriptional regulator YdaS (Cro superfamily)
MPAPAASPVDALRAAVTQIGTQQAMATLLGVAQPSVWRWMRSKRGLPAEHVLKVEQATGISRHDLRPDLYPEEAAQPFRAQPYPDDMEPAR